ncbi:MAG: DUF1641 domain-containing protein [Cyclonatronaceae bacterium]
MMENQELTRRIDTLEEKLDRVLDYVTQQRQQTEVVQDLIKDMSIIGHDFYDASVAELDRHDVELDPDDVKALTLNLIKNVGNLNGLLEGLSSLMDLKKDAGPILNEIIIETTKGLHQLDEKGYMAFVGELGTVTDTVVRNFSPDDIRQLAGNIVLILQTIKNLTQPDMLHAINNAVRVYGSIQTENIEPYSLWRAMREINSPEVRTALGFVIAFMKNLSNNRN